MPERLLELAGCRYHRGRYVPPSAGTMRRGANTIHADAADALVNAWPRRYLMPTPTARLPAPTPPARTPPARTPPQTARTASPGAIRRCLS